MIESHRAPEPVGPYPHARRVGNWLYLSGIGPRKRGSKEIPGVVFDENGAVREYDVEVQCRSMFENVRLVLEDAGAKWEHIVDVTVFLTDMGRDFAVYNRVYAEYFCLDPKPTRTTLGITALPTPIAVEIKVVAYVE